MLRMDVKNVLFNKVFLGGNTKYVCLGDLCAKEPCYGASAEAIERTNKEQPKYIRITDFDDWGIEENHHYMTAKEYSEKHLLKKNDIIFARTGGTVGKTYFYDGKIGKAIFAGYCIRFRFDEEKVIPKYVYWCTKTKRYVRWVEGVQRSAGQPNINKEEYKSYGIILPSMNKQRQLCDFMDNASEKYILKMQNAEKLMDALAENISLKLDLKIPILENHFCFAVKRSEVNKRLDVQANQPKYKHMLSGIKSKYGLIKIKDISEKIFSGITPKAKGEAYVNEDEEGVIFIRSGEINDDGTISKHINLKIKTEVHQNLMRSSQLQDGDVLIAIVGATIGRVAVFKGNTSANINQAIAAVRLKHTEYLPEFVMCYLKSTIGQMILEYLQRPVARANINLEEIGEIPLPIIPVPKQQEIIDYYHNIVQKCELLKTQAENGWREAKEQFGKDLLEG